MAVLCLAAALPGGPASAALLDEMALNSCRNELRDQAARIEACTRAFESVGGEDGQEVRAEVLRYRALAYRASGKTEEALLDMDLAVRIMPDHAGGWLLRAVMRADVGRVDEALLDVGRAQELSPRSPQVWRHKGVLLDKQGEFDKAYAALNTALELNPRYAEAYYDRGDLLRREGYLAEAIDDLSTMLELSPGAAKAWNARGSTWANLDDDRHALADFDQAIKLMPEFAAAYVNRASIRWRLNDRDGALTDYGRAIELEPTNVDAWANRARAFEAIGRAEDARHDMEMATALGTRRARADGPLPTDEDAAGPVRSGAYYLTVRPVNYREGPSTRSERLGSLGRGERVQVVGERDGWFEILLPGRGYAYVWRDFLEAAH